MSRSFDFTSFSSSLFVQEASGGYRPAAAEDLLLAARQVLDAQVRLTPVMDSPGAVKDFLAVCLGHQVLCETIAIPLAYKDIVFQGTQDEVVLDGRRERVGFYNTFVGKVDAATMPQLAGATVDADPTTGDVHAVRGPHYRGIQFHAESILTQHGADLIHRLAADLLA